MYDWRKGPALNQVVAWVSFGLPRADIGSIRKVVCLPAIRGGAARAGHLTVTTMQPYALSPAARVEFHMNRIGVIQSWPLLVDEGHRGVAHEDSDMPPCSGHSEVSKCRVTTSTPKSLGAA